jgi:Type I phosphodiesterase / nucleotide pyrophosphatase
MGLHFDPLDSTSHYLEILLAAAAENREKFDVYTPQTMPERYHFAHSTRIAPVYVVPRMGYVLTTRNEGDVGLSKGVSQTAPRFYPVLTNSTIFRITAMTTMTRLCMPYSWHMAPFLP